MIANKNIFWAIMLFLLLLVDPVYAQCPSMEQVRKGIGKFAAKGVQIITIQPTAYSEICEVHVRLQGRPRILYVGSKSDFFLMGQLYDASSGRNLTRNTLETITRFSSEEMARLKDLTAFSLGNSGKILYYVTDPKCSYCKKGSEILLKMASAGEVQVKFILFPLSKSNREQSVSVICDDKSLQEFESGYRSDNQCPDGIKKIERTFNLLKKKGIGGTPTYIFSDGRFHSGLLKEQKLRSRLGLRSSNSSEK